MQHRHRTYLRRLDKDTVRKRLTQTLTEHRRLVSLSLGLLAAVALFIFGAIPFSTRASMIDVLKNGSFEQGFASIPGCGVVGNGWDCFTNGGQAGYGFYDDMWDLVVADGKHSQLIEINTKDLATGDPDRYAGISQTVRVVKGAKYEFRLRGMIRTTNLEGDPWRYRVQVGYVDGPHGNWRHVHNWTDVGWDTYYDRVKPGSFSTFSTTLMPDDQVITVFVRVWKKWGVPYQELDVNLDSIALLGPSPDGGKMGGVGGPVDGPEKKGDGYMEGTNPMPEQPARPADGPAKSSGHDGMAYKPEQCVQGDLVYNGSFEHGFNRVGYGDVGRGWGAFTNGGAANYGFYAEEWEAVIADGKYGQLIEINTKGILTADADRYAGIYQRIEGLRPGETYKLTVRGLLRGEGNEDDPNRFAIEWGYLPGSEPVWQHVDHWEEMDLGPIYDRTEPVTVGTYTAQFKAHSPEMVLFIRGWKKWGVSEVEMDLNLDAISLHGCESVGQKPMPEKPMPEKPGGDKPRPDYKPDYAECTYIVKPGDTLAKIAYAYDVSSQDIIRANGIKNADIIFVGQKFLIPGCDDGNSVPMKKDEPEVMQRPDYPMEERPGPQPPMNRRPDSDGGPKQGMDTRTHTVQPGDSLLGISQRYGVDSYALAAANGIQNMNVIYVGQELRIP